MLTLDKSYGFMDFLFFLAEEPTPPRRTDGQSIFYLFAENRNDRNSCRLSFATETWTRKNIETIIVETGAKKMNLGLGCDEALGGKIEP